MEAIFFFFYDKSRNGKRYPFAYVIFFPMDKPVHELQVGKSVLIEFVLSKWQRVFSDQMAR